MSRSPSFRSLLGLLVAAGLATAPNALAEVITFDEIAPANANCCYLTNEYASLGVTFVTTDDGSIWGGLSAGNPGNWALEGTNGPAFLGFNGASFSAHMLFDSPVTTFSLDMAPSVGWFTPDDLFTLEGYRSGVLVDQVTMAPLGFGMWMSVALQGEIDEVRMGVVGPSVPNTYGIDNVQWVASSGTGGPGDPPPADEPTDPIEPDPVEPDPDDPEPAMLEAEVDVKPASSRNRINPFRRGRTRVAILGSEMVDASAIDVDSLRMGPDEAHPKRSRLRDVNRDGVVDLIVAFRTRDLGLGLGDEELCLTGSMTSGQQIGGCDSVKVRFKGWRWLKRQWRDRHDRDDD